ncbi:MAG: hypothetical protein IJW18_03690 [Lachnospiraceae bacterium]|nr:hypothetical protein [Lachnospiraceae bacterium]
MAKQKTNKPSILKIVLKAVAALFLLYMFVNIMIFTIFYMDEVGDYDDNLAYQVDGCNRYYYQKEYAELRDYLMLYNSYEDEFDMYWEIVDGYADYRQYLQWLQTPEDRVQGSSEMATMYKQRVIDNALNCRFEQNRAQLTKYAEEIK